MTRPLRIEFSGALYHITSRGDRRESIFEDDKDCETFLSVLAEVVDRFNWICHAYCLMTNHYHLLVETVDGNLSKGMRHLNGVFTQSSNRRHRQTGHLFQGRFKGILVEKDAYLMELSRYIVLNPVRAAMVNSPEEWPWSSYRATMGEARTPKWLSVDVLLNRFGGNRGKAQHLYRQFVLDGIGQGVWHGLRQQIYLGDDAFVARMQAKVRIEGDSLSVPKAQRRPPPPPLDELVCRYEERNEAIVAAYATGAYSYREIADYFKIHLATVGRIVRNSMQQSEN
jgi:REP element-mobilizing transposase RayT